MVDERKTAEIGSAGCQTPVLPPVTEDGFDRQPAGMALPPSPFASCASPLGSPKTASKATAEAAGGMSRPPSAADRPLLPLRQPVSSPPWRPPHQRPASAASYRSIGHASEASMGSRGSVSLADVLSTMSMVLPEGAPSEVRGCVAAPCVVPLYHNDLTVPFVRPSGADSPPRSQLA